MNRIFCALFWSRATFWFFVGVGAALAVVHFWENPLDMVF